MPKPDGTEYRGLSLWHDTVPGSLRPRAALPGDLDVDVAVVGAGFTGLWTAYYLLVEDPSVRVAVVDAHIAGFGASGRNGGWCSALFPTSASTLAARYGMDAARAHYHAMRESVREVVRVANAERIDADITLGGTIVLARNPPQLARAWTEIAESDRFGLGTTFLGPRAAGERLQATGTLGGTFRPHCATIHPAKLVRGLAECVERRGGRIFEQTPVAAIEPGRVVTSRGVVKADVIVRGTEGYTPAIAGQRRRLAPVYSLVIATAPLAADVWNVIGLAQRETWSDYRHLIIYGQRTAEDRMVFGGTRGPVPLRFADSRVFRSGATGLHCPSPEPARAVPRPGGRRDHPSVGRSARYRARLAGVRRRRSPDWPGVGRGIRGRRRGDDQPGWAHSYSTHSRRRGRSHPLAMGGSPIAVVADRTGALAGCQRSTPCDDPGGCCGSAGRPSISDRQGCRRSARPLS